MLLAEPCLHFERSAVWPALEVKPAKLRSDEALAKVLLGGSDLGQTLGASCIPNTGMSSVASTAQREKKLSACVPRAPHVARRSPVGNLVHFERFMRFNLGVARMGSVPLERNVRRDYGLSNRSGRKSARPATLGRRSREQLWRPCTRRRRPRRQPEGNRAAYAASLRLSSLTSLATSVPPATPHSQASLVREARRTSSFAEATQGEVDVDREGISTFASSHPHVSSSSVSLR